MIKTGFESRVKIQQIINNQLPEFLLDENPKAADFLKQYYISQEYQGGPVDIAENLDQYLKLDNLTPEVVVDSTILEVGIASTDTTIKVNSTKGFPSEYGLLKIDNEIITYTGLTTNTFTGCKRGFSGITSYHGDINQEELIFSSTSEDKHLANKNVQNLSSLFLKDFYKKLRYTFAPGFENINLSKELDVGNFIKEAKSFYQSKGTDESIRILFNVLYGVTPTVVNLEEFLIKPSSANYIRREVAIAEIISGDPVKLVGQTLTKSTDPTTLASISEVEPFTRQNKQYFKLSLFIGYDDNNYVEGNFDITPSTKSTEKVSIGSSIISVDSTVGFAKTGMVISGINSITYSDKSVNQFIGCTWSSSSGSNEDIIAADNIRSDEIYFGFEDGDPSKRVEIRLTGVLSEFQQVSNILKVSEGDIISVKNIGDLIENPTQGTKTYKQIFANSWIYNTSSTYDILSFGETLSLTLKSDIDRSSLKIGDRIEIVEKNSLGGSDTVVYPTDESVLINITAATATGTDFGAIPEPYVTDISGRSIQLQEFSGFFPVPGTSYGLRRKLNKAISTVIPIQYGNNKIISDIQNLYIDKNSEYAYVASNSLPSGIEGYTGPYTYEITKNINSDKIDSVDNLTDVLTNNEFTTIKFNNKAPFITGDRVYYQPDNAPITGIITGSYYVKVLPDGQSIKLYNSSSFMEDDTEINLSPPSGDFGTHTFTLYKQRSSIIGSQKLLKKFPLPPNIKNGDNELTTPENIGMLINGVEIKGYKSYDNVYYGKLESLNVLNGGKDYDVINLPVISISSGIGSTAYARPVISGSVEKVYVDELDFDISDVSSVTISGGNGEGAVLEPIVTKRSREVRFDGRGTDRGGGVTIEGSQLIFLEDHYFTDGEEVIYDSNNNLPTGVGIGTSTLSNGGRYFTSIDNNLTVKLFPSFGEYSSGINTIVFSGINSTGIHKFKTVSSKLTLSEIDVINGGSGYTNRKLIVKPTGINTVSNTINFKNHGFNDGDNILYSNDPLVGGVGVDIVGLTTFTGITTTSTYYKILKVDDNSFSIANAGVGATITSFYERRKPVNITSVGAGSSYHNFFYPPIEVNVNYTAAGIGSTSQVLTTTPIVRGSIIDAYVYEGGAGYGSTILNFEKKPNVTVKSGKNAELKPIVIGTELTNVNLEFGGSEYTSIPDLIVKDVSGRDKLGSGAELRPVISDGRIVDVKVINPGIGYSTTPLQTTILVKSAGSNAFIDPKIRKLSVNIAENRRNSDSPISEYLQESNNNLQYSVSGYFDTLRQRFNENSDGTVPSNIIGWAYDGNPIYGSYGYDDPSINANSRRLLTGYVKDSSNIEDRPSTEVFPEGFFVEDYKFMNNGDLDEHNGRFAKTPEFPDGVYAYYATIDGDGNPEFPYFVGDSYRSNTLPDNIDLNQDFDLNNSNLLRNTFPYKISDEFAGNDFIIETNEITRQKAVIESVTSGFVNDFNIVNKGNDYKVNDILTFDNEGTDGSGLISKISSIEGKDVVNIETSVENYPTATFTWEDESKVKVTILPEHNLRDGENIVISGFSTYLTELNAQHKIGITSYYSNLITPIVGTDASPGAATTEIYVNQIPTDVSIGSTIGIGSETVKLLDVYKNLNILRIKRSLTGTSHSISTKLEFRPDSFTIPTKKLDYFESSINKLAYFNARESVGTGITPGIVGHTTTFDFGDSQITRNIQTRSIYIENHPFETNEAVTLTIPTGGALSISTNPTATPFNLSVGTNNVYIVNKSINTIGIKTGIGTDHTGDAYEEVYFRNTPGQLLDNDEYLIETQFIQKQASVDRINSVVSVSTDHGMILGDKIELTVLPKLAVGVGTSTPVSVKWDDNVKNIVINPLTVEVSKFNSITNQIEILDHNLNTGDRVSYSSTGPISGLSTGSYYAFKVNDDNIKLCETLIDSQTNPPTVISIGNTAASGTHNISPINPRIKAVRGNSLVFDISDSSLDNHYLKLFYDNEFKNEFVSTATTSGFTVTGLNTTGGVVGAAITINYNTDTTNILPTKLYYNLQKSGYLSTADTLVSNHSEILFVDSSYTSDYVISGIGTTTFNIALDEIPEKLSYDSTDCSTLKYTTTSVNAQGSISKINIISGGSGYKKVPDFSSTNSVSGVDASIVAESNTIGNSGKVRIINEGFEYSSDKTLQPSAFISPLITIKDSNTIGIITVTDGGRNYTKPPDIVIVNTDSGKVIDSGILEAEIVGNSISKVRVEQKPKGLSEKTTRLYSKNNSNGISIVEVDSVSTGIGTTFTCTITTPPLNFSSDPFKTGDKVFIEGIQKVGTAGSGFNSADYGYKFLEVDSYDKSGVQDKVTIHVAGLTTATGIAKTIQDSIGTIIHEDDYPSFSITQEKSTFIVGEKLIVDNIERDLVITGVDIKGLIKVFGTYELSVNETITGKQSGTIATIELIETNTGRFLVNYSNKKDIGWQDSVGKLDEDNQVIADNDYYQNLSYTIKSPITWKELSSPVNNLVHTSGLKNFADTGITSTTTVGIGSSAGSIIIKDILEENRVDTINNFDLAVDIDLVGNTSKFIKLKTRKLTDYIVCKTNGVLTIDNINDKFSNLGDDPNTFIDLFKISSSLSYDSILVRVNEAFDNQQVQLTELVILNDGDNNFILEKASLDNSGTEVNHLEDKSYGTFSIFVNEFNDSFLRFTPKDSIFVDYDVKYRKSVFDGSTSGIGTQTVGFIDLTGVAVGVASTTNVAGITSSIIGVGTHKFNSLFVNTQVINNTTREMNFVDIFLVHDGTNTYISDYYFDSDKKFTSDTPIGSFNANISSGLLSLNYTNDIEHDVSLKSKIVGFGTTGSGEGTYRFKLNTQNDGQERTSIYQSNFESTVAAAATTVFSLDKNLFNAVKSYVEVGMGVSKALHEVLTINDIASGIYVQQSPFLSVASTTAYDSAQGIGTFGGVYSGDNFILKFYPDAGMTSEIKISSFNECFYTFVDTVNTPPDTTYGNVIESIDHVEYNALKGKRINRTAFPVTHNGDFIFTKSFNPKDSNDLNLTSGTFTIKNHFYSTGEELEYTPKATFVGVGSTAMTDSTGTPLPSSVFAIKVTDDSFQIATTRALAELGTNVSFGSSGEGNAHELTMAKRNEKSLISIDNIAQYPLIYTPISHTLSGNGGQIGTASTYFALSGIGTIGPEDILRINDEYVKVRNVGFGTTAIGPITGVGASTIVNVDRGVVGSSATSHIDGSTVRLFKGSYNITGKNINFISPPTGTPTIQKNNSNLEFPKSDFNGRVFLRQNYDTNQIYDDISDQFTGIATSFILTVGGANTAGIGTTGGNGILFINSIFQTPSTQNNPTNNFEIIDPEENIAGVSTVVFSGITTNDGSDLGGEVYISESDVNINQLPRGGVIVSLGATGGTGYAPLLGAQVRPITGAGGSITSVVGFATTGFALAISTASYNNVTGLLDVTTVEQHGLVIGETNEVTMVGLHFACTEEHAGVTTTIFPDTINNRPFNITGISSVNTFTADVGVCTIPHTYVGQGTVFSWYGNLTYGQGYNDIISIGIAVTDKGYEHKFIGAANDSILVAGVGALTPTDAFYESHSGRLILTINNHNLTTSNVIGIGTDSLLFTCSRDNHSTSHSYPRSGVTPSSLNGDPIFNNMAIPIVATTTNTIEVNVGAASSGSGATITAHPVGVNTHIFFSGVSGGIRRLSGTPGNLTALTGTEYDPSTGVLLIKSGAHSLSAATYKDITDADYTATTGIMTVTSASHGFSNGDYVKIVENSLTFTCDKDGGVSDHTYPRNTDPIYNKWIAIANKTTNTFELQVGISTAGNYIHTYVGGTATNALIKANSFIGISTGAITFTCAADSHKTLHPYPRTTDPFHWTNGKVLGVETVGSATSFTVNVGKSPNGSGGALTFTIGAGGTNYTNPRVFVSDPTYSNLNIKGISRLGEGVTDETGTGLLLDIGVSAASTVGLGSNTFEVSSYKIARNGYAFKRGDVIRPVGLVTHRTLQSTVSELQLTVDEIFTDTFASWQFGEFDFIDSVKKYQDGRRVRFPLYYNNQLLSFEAESGSYVDVQTNLFITINGIIQNPGEAYQFEGGTSFVFTTAPKEEDNIAIFFYRGTRNLDDSLVSGIKKTLQRGDIVRLYRKDAETESQDSRTIYDLSYSDKFETDVYSGKGVDDVNFKPLSWTKQKVESVINGEVAFKSRDSIESQIYPVAKIIGNVGTSQTSIFVDSIELFEYDNAVNYEAFIISKSSYPVAAAITATVSAAGTISGLHITNGGSNYDTAPTIKISAPPNIKAWDDLNQVYVGVGSTATATLGISGVGTVNSFAITNSGAGYTIAPQIVVSVPNPTFEYLSNVNGQGFSGIVTGITTTTVGVSTLGFKFFVSKPTAGWTGMEVGNPLYIFDTNLGYGATSIDRTGSDSAVVGIGTTFLDNIYIIDDFTFSGSTGIVTTLVASNPVGIATSMGTKTIGKFSWGKLTGTRSTSTVSIAVTNNVVDVGITTFPVIQRRGIGLRNTGALPKLL